MMGIQMKSDLKQKGIRNKVLLVVPSLETGGGEKLVLDIATNLDSNKFEVVVLSFYPRCGKPFEKIADDNAIRTVFLTKTPGVKLGIVKDIYKVMKEFRPDVVHTHLMSVSYTLIPTLLTGVKKKIHTLHCEPKAEAEGILRIIMHLAYRTFGYIPVAISDVNKKLIIELYKLKENKVVVINNGVDIERFEMTRPLLNNDKTRFRFVTVGRLVSIKNHKLMVEAFALLFLEYKNIELILVGEGELYNEINDYIQSKNLQDYVILKGVTNEIPKILNSSDVFVLSSDSEGLPLSVLEAMASGLPIVTTKAGGIVDIVESGVNGLITPILDAPRLAQSMKYMYENEKERLVMGTNSRKKASDFDIKHCVKQYEMLYELGYL